MTDWIGAFVDDLILQAQRNAQDAHRRAQEEARRRAQEEEAFRRRYVPASPQRDLAMARLFRAGVSLARLADEFGLRPETIALELKRLGELKSKVQLGVTARRARLEAQMARFQAERHDTPVWHVWTPERQHAEPDA